MADSGHNVSKIALVRVEKVGGFKFSLTTSVEPSQNLFHRKFALVFGDSFVLCPNLENHHVIPAISVHD